MARFRKKPVEIEAVQYDGTFPLDFLTDTAQVRATGPDSDAMVIQTLEGEMTAQIGDWIIKGVAGEFYPCKPDIFDATYEPVAQGEAAGGESIPEFGGPLTCAKCGTGLFHTRR